MDQAKECIIAFLSESKAALFTTISDESYPDSRMIGPFVNDNLIVYIFTLCNSNKINQVNQNSHVSLYIQNKFESIKDYTSLLISGIASKVVTAEETTKVKNMMEVRCKGYKNWIDKDGWEKWSIIKISPEILKYTNNSQSNKNLILKIN
jgi:nitroimidazol reductase NimA-like FMN-containing flavoprotein (pyridoxamine 5'-phosphate oxidase superfamily)